MARILIVEDEPLLLRGLKETLLEREYEVAEADSAERAELVLAERPVDLILLDLMLPGKDGYTFLKELRQKQDSTPAIIMSCRGDEVDKIQGFRSGADDYVVKPFGLMELLERIRVVLRRSPAKDVSTILSDGELVLDVKRFEARLSGQLLAFAPKEFLILKILLTRKGEVVTRDVLFDEVWGYEKIPNTRTLDNHILRIRSKLGDDPANPRFIRTVHGVGYCFGGTSPQS